MDLSGDPHAEKEENAIVAQDYYENISRWVHSYPVPSPGSGFAALSATNLQLAGYGLPERPNAVTEPELYRFWEKMLGGSTEVVAPEFPTDKEIEPRGFVAHRHGPGAQRRTAGPAIRGFDHREDSRNWSGAYITPTRPNRFVQVMGGWTVPAPEAPRVPPSGADRDNVDYHSSTWIGIGGHRPYNSLPQIGTAQRVVLENGQPTVVMGAWFQWWVKGRRETHKPIPILNFPVAAGDEILASLTVDAPGDVHFNLKNQRTGRHVTFKAVAPAGILPLGATAEWVHERPTKIESRDLHPLPRCTDVVFDHCLALSAPKLGGLAKLETLDNHRLIRMYEDFDDPHRTAFVSIPEKTGATSVRIRYREPGV